MTMEKERFLRMIQHRAARVADDSRVPRRFRLACGSRRATLLDAPAAGPELVWDEELDAPSA